MAVARALEAESGVRCVPLFWLQTEDHDFAEIASVSVATGDGGTLRLALAADAGSAPRASRGRAAPRGRGRVAPRRGWRRRCGPAAAATETVALLRRHYQPGRPVAAAFAGAMAELFADEGLLFFDPRDARVARARRADSPARHLGGGRARRSASQERSAALAAAGFDEQIPCRPDCALSSSSTPTAPRVMRFRLARRAGAPDGGRVGTVGPRRHHRAPTRSTPRSRASRCGSRRRRCCGRSSRTACCRPRRTSAAPPRSATSPSSGRSTTRSS